MTLYELLTKIPKRFSPNIRNIRVLIIHESVDKKKMSLTLTLHPKEEDEYISQCWINHLNSLINNARFCNGKSDTMLRRFRDWSELDAIYCGNHLISNKETGFVIDEHVIRVGIDL